MPWHRSAHETAHDDVSPAAQGVSALVGKHQARVPSGDKDVLTE